MRQYFAIIITLLAQIQNYKIFCASNNYSINYCRGYSYDNIDLGCTQCEDQNCSSCFYQTCVLCTKAYDEVLGRCLSQNEQCTKGYYLNENNLQCQKCLIPGCLECSDLQTCELCNNGFIITSNKTCVKEDILNDNTKDEYQNLKQIVDKSKVTFHYQCPPLYEVNDDDINCERIQYCSNKVIDEETYLKDQIQQILILNQQESFISITKKQIVLINQSNQKIDRVILNLFLNPSEDQSKKEEFIHRAILVLNILNVFTNQRILAYNTENLKLVKYFSFQSGNTFIDFIDRFDYDPLLKQILIVNQDTSNEINYLSVVTLQFDLLSEKIIPESYEIKQIENYSFNLLQQELFSITLNQKIGLILITSREECIAILINNLTQVTDLSRLRNLEEIDSNLTSQYLVSGSLDSESAIQEDKIIVDEENELIYILRKLQNTNLLYKININKRDITLSIERKELPISKIQFYTLQATPENIKQQYGKYLILYMFTTFQISQENSGQQYLEIESLSNQSKQKFILPMKDNINQQISSIYIHENSLNNQPILLVSTDQYLHMFNVDLNIKILSLKLALNLNRLFPLDFNQIASSKYQPSNTEEEPSYDLYFPQYSTLYTLRISQKQIRVLRSAQQIFEDHNDLFNLPFIYQNATSASQLMELDEFNNHIYLFDYIPEIQAITIYKVEVDTNKFLSFNTLYLDSDCTSTCFQKAIINVQDKLIILVLKNFIYNLHLQSFQVISYQSFQGLIDFRFPYLALYLREQKNVNDDFSLIQLLKIDEQLVLKEQYRFQNNLYQAKNIFRVSTLDTCFVIASQVDQIKYNLIIKCNQDQIGVIQQLSEIQQIEFFDDNTFVVIYIDGILITFKKYTINLTNKSLTSNNPQGLAARNDFNIAFQLLYLKDNIQFYVIKSNSVPYIFVYYFTGNTYGLIDTKEDLSQNGFLIIQQLTFDYKEKKLYYMVKRLSEGNVYMETYIFAVQYQTLVNRFDKELYKQFNKSFFDTKMNTNYQLDNGYFHSENAKTSYLFTVKDSSFLGIQLNHFQKQLKSSLQILDSKSLVYFNDGTKSMVLQGLQNPSSNKIVLSPYIQSDYGIFHNRWWISEKLGYIILAKQLTFFDEDIKSGYPPISFKVQFLYLDTLEEALPSIEQLSPFAQVFWFDKYETLIVISEMVIHKYKIVNSQISLEYSFFPQYLIFGECDQVFQNPLILCSQYGVFDFELKKEIILTNLRLEQHNYANYKAILIKENDQYLYFEPNNWFFYDIQKQILTQNYISADKLFSKLTLIRDIPNSALYFDKSSCTVYLLPSLEIIYVFSASSSSSTFGCWYFSDVKILSTYNDGTLISYKYPIDQTGIPSIQFQGNVGQQYTNYFNQYELVSGKYLVSVQNIYINSNDVYKKFMVFNVLNGEIKEIQSYYGTFFFFSIVGFWAEKQIILTEQQIFSFSDLSISFNIQGSSTDLGEQRYIFMNKLNYIFYENKDVNNISILDVSQLLPINKSNSQLTSRYQIQSTNYVEKYPFIIGVNILLQDIVYFDWFSYQLVKTKLTLNQKNLSYQQSIKSSTLIDLSSILNQVSSLQYSQSKQELKTTYQIYKISSNQQQSIYVININCQLVLVRNNGVLQEIMDLSDYQCKIQTLKSSYSKFEKDEMNEEGQQYKLILIKNYKFIFELQFDEIGNKAQLIEIYEELDQASYIKSFMSVSNNYFLIIYTKPFNAFKLIKGSGLNALQKLYTLTNSVYINCFLQLSWQSQIFLLVGTDTSFIPYKINEISQTNFDLVETNLIQIGLRGEVKQMKYFISDQLNIIVSTQKRLLLLQNGLPTDTALNLQIKRENILHTRFNHRLRIINDNKLVVILSQLQISVYSAHSLQYLGNVEEENTKSFFEIKSVQIKSLVYLIITEQEKIMIYDLSKFSSKQNFILQKEFYQPIPQIYSIISSIQLQEEDINYFIVSGSNINSPFSFKFFPSSQNKDDTEEECISDMKFPNDKYLQERIYEELYMNNDMLYSEDTQKIYIELDTTQVIFIPINLVNANQHLSNRKFDIQINLMQHKGIIYSYSFNQTNGLVKSLKIFNGHLQFGEDIALFNLNTFSIQDVGVSFTDQGHSLSLINIEKITFENILFQKQTILNNKRVQQRNNNEEVLDYLPLIFCKNSSEVIISKVRVDQIRYERDLIQFQQNKQIIIKQFQIYSSSILGSLLIFDNRNANINISKFLINNSKILQVLKAIITSSLKISQIQINNSQNILTNSDLPNGSRRMLQDLNNNLSSQNSFIYIRAISEICDMEQIAVQKKSNFYKFLDYSNYYFIDNITYESLEAVLNLSNILIDDSSFTQNYLLLKETLINLKNLEVQNCQNPQFSINDAIRGVNIINVNFYNNKYEDQSQLIIQNSLILLNRLNFYNNKILINSEEIQKTNIHGVEIKQSMFYFNNIVIHNNQSPSYYISINGVYQITQNTVVQQSYQQQTINRLVATYNSDSVIHMESLKQVSIISSIFNDNNQLQETINGGAINMIDVELCKFIDTEIKNNRAKLYGGGIHMENSDLWLKNTVISKNKALIGGGVRYINTQSKKKPLYFLQSKIQDQIYDNNGDVFGKNYASVPNVIKIQTNLDDWNTNQNQYSTSLIFQIYGEDLELANFEHPSIQQSGLSDELKQEIRKYTSFILSSYDNTISIERQAQEYIKDKQIFNITSFVVNSGYQSLVDKSQKTNESKQLPRRQLLLANYYYDHIKIVFSVSFRNCITGEIIQKLSGDSYQCFLCEGNTYSIQNPYDDIGNQKCNQCPIGGQYCQGNILIPLQEYWIEEGTDYIQYCSNRPQKCTLSFQAIEENSLSNKQYQDLITTNGCSEGGIGPLCESCDYHNIYWGKGGKILYAKQSRYSCYNCSDTSENFTSVGLPIILIIIFFIYIQYQVFTNVNNQLIHLKTWLFRQIQVIFISSSLFHKDKSSTLLKIIISYIQIVSVVSSFNLKIPEVVQNFFFFIGSILDISFYTLDCFFIKTGLSSYIKMVYLRLIWTVLSPVVFALLLLAVGYILVKKWKLKKYKNNILISGLMQLYYLIFPGLINQSLGTICCQVINGKSYVLLDTQYECYDKEYFIYNFIFSVPFFLLTIYLPYFIYSQLKKNEKNLSKIHVYLNYGFFYQEYNDSKYYWEFIKIYQKIFLQCAVNIFNQSNIIMGIIVSLSIIFYIVFQEKMNPYKLKFFNYIDQSSQFTAILTIYSIIINSESTSDFLSYLFLIIAIAINSFFILRAFIYLSIFSNYQKIFSIFLKCSGSYLKVISQSIIQQLNSNNIARVSKNWRLVSSYIEQSKQLRLSSTGKKIKSIEDRDQNELFNTSQQKDNNVLKSQSLLQGIEETSYCKGRLTANSFNFNQQMINEEIAIRNIDTKQACITLTELQKF